MDQPVVDDERADSELVASCSCLAYEACTKRKRWIWSPGDARFELNV